MTSPNWFPDVRVLDDLTLMWVGALPRRFSGATSISVTEAIARQALEAGELTLVDGDGTPLASVTSPAATGTSPTQLSGEVHLLNREIRPFADLLRAPECLPAAPRVLVERPLTRDDLSQLTREIPETPVLLVRSGRDFGTRQVTPEGLIRSTVAAGISPYVAAVPLSDHDGHLDEEVLRSYAPEGFLRLRGRGELLSRVREALTGEVPEPANQGVVVMFTGLSGSGKSTLASALHRWLVEHTNRQVTVLDGDLVRRHLSKGLGFSQADRETNVLRIGWVAAEIARHHGIALCSPIAPFEASREETRRMVEEAGGRFVLIHVSTPLAECERRDVKGLYAKARSGEIAEFTGISSPYEPPSSAELLVDTSQLSIQDALKQVLDVTRLGATETTDDPGDPHPDFNRPESIFHARGPAPQPTVTNSSVSIEG